MLFWFVGVFARPLRFTSQFDKTSLSNCVCVFVWVYAEPCVYACSMTESSNSCCTPWTHCRDLEGWCSLASPTEETSLEGILDTNCFRPDLSTDVRVLCPTLARFNHSCLPNCTSAARKGVTKVGSSLRQRTSVFLCHYVHEAALLIACIVTSYQWWSCKQQEAFSKDWCFDKQGQQAWDGDQGTMRISACTQIQEGSPIFTAMQNLGALLRYNELENVAPWPFPSSLWLIE